MQSVKFLMLDISGASAVVAIVLRCRLGARDIVLGILPITLTKDLKVHKVQDGWGVHRP